MRSFWAAATLTVLGGCAWEPLPAPDAPVAIAHPAQSLRGAAAQTARAQVGTPYRWGGDGAGGFDCSGLVHYAYAAHGIDVPRTTAGQRRRVEPVALTSALPGDLVFFETGAKTGHVGVYLGDGRFVHAPSSGKAVTVARLDTPYYRRNLRLVGRVPVSR